MVKLVSTNFLDIILGKAVLPVAYPGTPSWTTPLPLTLDTTVCDVLWSTRNETRVYEWNL